MTTEVKKTYYANGKRYEEQVAEYSKSDDLIRLAQLYDQQDRLFEQIEEAKKNGETTKYLEESLERTKSDLSDQQRIVDGYDKNV